MAKHTHVGVCHIPTSGKCWSCSFDLVRHYQETGKSHGTRCPSCNRSFVE